MTINRNLDISSYTDFQGLARLKNSANSNPHGAVKQVAEQFETQFIQMMLKSMRDATPKNPLFGGKHMKMFQGMFDKEIAQKMAEHGGIGLAGMIEQQLSRHVGGAQASGPKLNKQLDTVKSFPLQQDAHKAYAVKDPNQAHVFAPPTRDPALRPMAFRDAMSSRAATHAAAAAANQAGKAALDGSAPTQASASLPGGSASPAYWDSPQAFVSAIMPHAKAAAKKLGVPAEVLVAQSALETGWGKHVPKDASGRPNFNFFGIKADSNWQGSRQTSTTLEFNGHAMVKKQASFRAYHQVGESFDDLVNFLQSNPRYQQALSVKHDPVAFARALQKAGYATDPQYADKLIAIMRSGRIPSPQTAGSAG